MSSPIADALASCPIFDALGTETIAYLAEEVEQVHLPGGEDLFYHGDAADCMYVVVTGRLRVVADSPDGGSRVLGEVGPGGVLGEMAVLTGGTRSATARAVRDTDLLRLDEAAFNSLLERQPAMMMRMTRLIIARYQESLRSGGARRSGRIFTIAVVPTSDDVPVGEFARRLVEALEYGSSAVLHLDSGRVDEAIGAGSAQTPTDHARHSEVSNWLMEQEAQYDFLVYQADRTLSTWTRRCLRQADQILLVGSSGLDPRPGPIERSMERSGLSTNTGRKELVLLHASARNLYPDTEEWLKPRDVERHHHVVLDSARDYGRLVRTITGRSVGLVLGGGGARCFAQIGVLRALIEAGVPIDIIGGTSMGAYLAAQYALGWDIEEMLAFNRRIWSQEQPLKEYTLPFVGFVAGNRFVRITRETYGEANIEDFGVPFFCCSSNITTAQVMVHDRGTVWRWLGASIAVPGISPPLFDRGELLVDGAVLDNLPVDIMRARCDGTVIAVDVSPIEDLRTDPVYSMCPSAWHILANRLNPFSEPLPVPGLFEILQRCAMLSSVQQVETMKQLSDLYIHPPTEPFSMFDWQRVDDLADVGYRHASEQLADWEGAADLTGLVDAAPPPTGDPPVAVEQPV